ncbi:MAG: serine hydrolase domain-containing protein, partial [Pseudomonadota bacterium]
MEALQRLTHAIDDIRSDYPAYGSSITVVEDGETQFFSASGFANVEHQVPITEDTVFDLASIAKTFTGYAIAQLEESGALSTDDDIRTHLPNFPDLGHDITIAHLLHHTSGIKNWTTLLWRMNWPYGDEISYDFLLRLAYAQTELDFVPGERYEYSNTGYVLLVAIIEKVTGQDFADWMDERVFTPLSMDKSFFKTESNLLTPNMAQAYYFGNEGQALVDSNRTTALGSSSLFSTAPDMVKWMNHLMNPGESQQPVVERMFTTRPLNDGSENNYAYGIVIDEFEGEPFINHSGSWASYTSHMALMPERNSALFLAQNFRANTQAIINLYAETLIAGDIDTDSLIASNSGDVTDQEEPVQLGDPSQFEGTFRLGEAWFVNIRSSGDGLTIQANGERAFPMTPVEEDLFRVS